MQDSFGNPIPDPTADAAPETDAPAVDTPTETPAVDPIVDSAADMSSDVPADAPATAPVVDTPLMDEPAAETPAVDSATADTPATDTSSETPSFSTDATAPVVDASATTPASTATPASVIAPTGGEKKSNTGLIIGIIVAVLIIGIIAAVAVIFMNHSDDGKKDATSSETQTKEDKKSEEKKEDKKEPKTATKSVPIKYNGKDITISMSFGDTVKSFAQSNDLYKVVDFMDTKIDNIDDYLSTTLESKNDNVRVNVLDEEEFSIFEINAATYDAEEGKDTYADLELSTIYFWPDTEDTITLNGHEITTQKSTESDVEKSLGTPEDKYDSGTTYTYDYKINGVGITVFFSNENEDGVRVVDFITIN